MTSGLATHGFAQQWQSADQSQPTRLFQRCSAGWWLKDCLRKKPYLAAHAIGFGDDNFQDFFLNIAHE